MPDLTLSYLQAIRIIQEHSGAAGKLVRLPLSDCLGFALAETLIASEPNPRFDNSSVDGFAVGSLGDGSVGARLKVVGQIAAGGSSEAKILPGTAVRILTGAPVPFGTFGIAMQEDVDRDGDSIVLKCPIQEGQFVRPKGADFQPGDQLAKVGAVIGPGLAAQLASVGCMTPMVFGPPAVAVITTGDELVDPTQDPGPSQIRDTNLVMLELQVAQSTKALPSTQRIADDRDQLLRAIQNAAEVNEIILVSGGASVGDKDYLDGIIREIGTVHFHGVSIRPGKPLLFGQIGKCLVFGLPGNPASVFVCFEIFVRECIRRLSGWADASPRWVDCRIGFDHKACGREDFVRVCWAEDHVVELRQQGSFGLSSLAAAHGLVRLSATEGRPVGSLEKVLWLG